MAVIELAAERGKWAAREFLESAVRQREDIERRDRAVDPIRAVAVSQRLQHLHAGRLTHAALRCQQLLARGLNKTSASTTCLSTSADGRITLAAGHRQRVVSRSGSSALLSSSGQSLQPARPGAVLADVPIPLVLRKTASGEAAAATLLATRGRALPKLEGQPDAPGMRRVYGRAQCIMYDQGRRPGGSFQRSQTPPTSLEIWAGKEPPPGPVPRPNTAADAVASRSASGAGSQQPPSSPEVERPRTGSGAGQPRTGSSGRPPPPPTGVPHFGSRTRRPRPSGGGLSGSSFAIGPGPTRSSSAGSDVSTGSSVLSRRAPPQRPPQSASASAARDVRAFCSAAGLSAAVASRLAKHLAASGRPPGGGTHQVAAGLAEVAAGGGRTTLKLTDEEMLRLGRTVARGLGGSGGKRAAVQQKASGRGTVLGNITNLNQART